VRVEFLYFEGCKSYERLLPRLRQLVAEAGGDPEAIELLAVESAEAAERARFLGSPTIRVDGRDVEPGADARRDFGLTCRLYSSDAGPAAAPPDAWIRTTLADAA
jgi:hypothetical protein